MWQAFAPAAFPGSLSPHIHDNTIDAGGECVSVKEAATANRIEANTCSGQLDANSGAIEIRGNTNVVVGNTVTHGKGAGIRLEGATRGDGVENDVVDNTLRGNRAGGINFMAAPQGRLCGNDLADQSNPKFGKSAVEFAPTASCSTRTDSRLSGADADETSDLGDSSTSTEVEEVIDEDFSSISGADSFDVVSGGKWTVTGGDEGVYRLTDPGAKKKANGNVSVHNCEISRSRRKPSSRTPRSSGTTSPCSSATRTS